MTEEINRNALRTRAGLPPAFPRRGSEPLTPAVDESDLTTEEVEDMWEEAEPVEEYKDHSTEATHDYREGWDESDVDTLIKYLESDKTHAEIAEAMGRTVNGVTGKIYRLRKQGKIE